MPESHDVTISYNNSTIAYLDASGTEVLETNGTICAGDITIEYNKPAAPTPSLQAKTNIAPTTSSQTITPDVGYDGLSSVQINAMPAQTLPGSLSNAPVGTLQGEIGSSSYGAMYLNLPVGYNSSAKYYKIKAISPTKNAQTYTPTTTNQYIYPDQWIRETQTILGDANLLAGNIKKDVTIFGVTGDYEGSGGGGGGSVAVSLFVGNSSMLDASGTVYYLDANGDYQTGTFTMDEEYNYTWSGTVLAGSLFMWEAGAAQAVPAFTEYPTPYNATKVFNKHISAGSRPAASHIYYALYQANAS